MRGAWWAAAAAILVVSVVASAVIAFTDVGAGATASDTRSFDGLLLSDEDGVHVIDEDGEVLVTLLDHPVERVFDDGQGGIVYNLYRSGRDVEEWYSPYYDRPGSRAEAALWHLPVGAARPQPLIVPDDESRAWTILEGVGKLGDRTVVAYADMSYDDSQDEDSTHIGDLMIFDLGSGASHVVLAGTYGWELGVTGVSFAGGQMAFDNGYSVAQWHLVDESLDTSRAVECETSEDLTDLCELWPGALLEGDTVVGLYQRTFESDPVLARGDLTEGSVDELDVEVSKRFGDWFGVRSVVAHDARVLVSHRPDVDSDELPAVLYDLETEEVTELDVDGLVTFLRAPIRRPVG